MGSESCTNTTIAKLPSANQIRGLSIELFILIAIYALTLLFTLYNIYAYLWKQRRYRTMLITFFYIFAMIVLTTRITQYCFTLTLNNQAEDIINEFNTNPAAALVMDYTSVVKTYRKVAQCFTYSDYSKIALGFVQLCSMARLAIEIRYSVYHLV